MSKIINNVDLDKVAKTTESGKKEKLTLRKPVKLYGEWNLGPTKGYQFRTELTYEKGKQVVEIDSPSFLGGNGTILGPMAYCIAGITSCFIATFVTVASSKGIRFSKLNVNTQCDINFAKTFDVADEPLIDGVEFQIEAESPNGQLQGVIRLAKKIVLPCIA
jgi:uncharacterized OsmC-like protein